MRAARLQCVRCGEGGCSEVGGGEKWRSGQSPPLLSWVWDGHSGQLLPPCWGALGVWRRWTLCLLVVLRWRELLRAAELRPS